VTCHDRKDALFHLAGILGTKNDHFHSLEVDFHGSCGTHTFGETVCRELTSVVDDEVWLAEVGKLLFGGPNKHVVLDHQVNLDFNDKICKIYHKESVVSTSANNSNFDTVLGIPLKEGLSDETK